MKIEKYGYKPFFPPFFPVSSLHQLRIPPSPSSDAKAAEQKTITMKAATPGGFCQLISISVADHCL